MQGAGQWLEALDARRAAPVRMLFARLGVVAACRPLSPGELAECLEMGGQRGARYALYLSCDSLREAGERRVLEGAALSPLDITEGLAYSDILAAAGIIARLSGAGPALVRQLAEDEDAQSAIEAGMSEAGGYGWAEGNPIATETPAGGGEAEVNPFAAAAPAGGGEADVNPFAAAAPSGGEETEVNPFAAETPVGGGMTALDAHGVPPSPMDADGAGATAQDGLLRVPDGGDERPLAHGMAWEAAAHERPLTAGGHIGADWGQGASGGRAAEAALRPMAAEQGAGVTAAQAQHPQGGLFGGAGRSAGVAEIATPGLTTEGARSRLMDDFARTLADRLRDAAGNM